MTIGVFLRVDTGVILFGDAIQATQCLVLAELKVCLITDCIVGKLSIRISRILYSTCVNDG